LPSPISLYNFFNKLPWRWGYSWNCKKLFVVAPTVNNVTLYLAGFILIDISLMPFGIKKMSRSKFFKEKKLLITNYTRKIK